ncbi:hypothetical protein IMCC1989_469 [gamma proteobacterium IMCC1989]|nr:hypothetical protein IMCC1989_469 [gamma proteobacterium IMCC1989]
MFEQTMRVDVYSSTIARIEGGQVYSAIYVGQKVVNEEEENTKGLSLMKVACDPSVYETIDLSSVPLSCEIKVRLKKGAGGKMNNHCTAVTLLPNKPSKPS